MFAQIDVSTSGLTAERTRMEVIANNVANANVTQGPNGEPFRRREVVFSTLMDGETNKGAGVEVVGIQSDQSELPRIYKPGHPHADAEGYVTMRTLSFRPRWLTLWSRVAPMRLTSTRFGRSRKWQTRRWNY